MSRALKSAEVFQGMNGFSADDQRLEGPIENVLRNCLEHHAMPSLKLPGAGY